MLDGDLTFSKCRIRRYMELVYVICLPNGEAQGKGRDKVIGSFTTKSIESIAWRSDAETRVGSLLVVTSGLATTYGSAIILDR